MYHRYAEDNTVIRVLSITKLTYNDLVMTRSLLLVQLTAPPRETDCLFQGKIGICPYEKASTHS